MAGTLYYSTYAALPKDNGQPMPMPDLSNVLDAGSITSVSTTSQQSSATNVNARFVMLTADGGDINVLAGANPTALATSPPILDGGTSFFAITGGHKIAARNPS